jgi:hypothetical protein
MSSAAESAESHVQGDKTVWRGGGVSFELALQQSNLCNA